MTKKKPKEAKYKIAGMHCASCELLVGQELGKLPGVSSAVASTANGSVSITYTGVKPTTTVLNDALKPFGYSVDETEGNAKKSEQNTEAAKIGTFLPAVALAALVLAAFAALQHLSNLMAAQIELQGVVTYFLFGVAASLSSCAALVGGLVLSMSKDWNQPGSRKPFPLIQFNLGRLLGFTFLGGVLGLAGGVVSLSIEFTAILVIITSLVMLLLGVQMTGLIPALNKFQLKLPGKLGQKVMSAGSSSARFGPLFIGIGTFLIPCSFTLIAQVQALSSGSFMGGAMILGSFALGTIPVLLVIGLTARHFSLDGNLRDLFLKTAGIVVIVFALYTLGNQLNVVGILPAGGQEGAYSQLPAAASLISDGIQRAKLTAVDMGYLEKEIVLRQGIPAELTIFGQTFGCANAVVARDFWPGAILVQKGRVETVTFTPEKTGVFRGSCTMGMYTFKIRVIQS